MSVEDFSLQLWHDIYPLNWLLGIIVAILIVDKLERKWHDRPRIVYTVGHEHREIVYPMSSPQEASHASQRYQM